MTPREIDSLPDFRAAVCDAVEAAVAQRCRRLVLVDEALGPEWPLDDAALLAALTAFVRLPDRRVVLLANQHDAVLRSCPRFMAWRQVWGHAVDPLRPADDGVRLPTLLLADRRIALRVIDRERWRGRLVGDDPEVHHLADEVDAFAQRSEPTLGARPLGL